MASTITMPFRPLSLSQSWKTVFRPATAITTSSCTSTKRPQPQPQTTQTATTIITSRSIHSHYRNWKATLSSSYQPPPTPTAPGTPHIMRKIKTYPPPPSTANTHPDPITHLHNTQISALDPSGARRALFNPSSPTSAKVGDILLVRLRSGSPSSTTTSTTFSGICLDIRHRGIESGILLRNQLTKVGVEMWFKIYSPNVEGVEVVQRRGKRARRARLTYLRLPRHDVGSVEGTVRQYLKDVERERGAREVRERKVERRLAKVREREGRGKGGGGGGGGGLAGVDV